jgi:aminoglycoside phosphotransferase (APT) family kinase protein
MSDLNSGNDQIDDGALAAALARMRLVAPGDTPRIEPLTGGVSSDIWRVETAGGPIAIKRARAQLKVAQAWYAPVERNAYEVKWFRIVEGIAPGATPEVLGEDREAGLFAMRYLEPDDHPIWKNELHEGRVDVPFAAEVGRRLARIHTLTAGNPQIAKGFATDATFHAIRLEAYLEATARAHPRVGERLMTLSRDTLATRRALVHGDISPKNILAGPAGPVFLDAECAWYGDPAFDLAFCLKHLLLKCLWTPSASARFLAAFDALAGSYLDNATFEPREPLEARIAHLLPGLWLARVDGKSPVEYLDEEGKARVRAVALALLARPPDTLHAIRAAWAGELGVQPIHALPSDPGT